MLNIAGHWCAKKLHAYSLL